MFNNLLQAFQILSNNINSMEWFWRGWIYFMAFVNAIVPIFFLPKFTAILVMLSGFVGLITGLVIIHATGYSKLLGLMHLPWVPMVCFQIYYFYHHGFKLKDPHDIWFLVSLIISLFSLVIDFYDIHTFMTNEK